MKFSKEDYEDRYDEVAKMIKTITMDFGVSYACIDIMNILEAIENGPGEELESSERETLYAMIRAKGIPVELVKDAIIEDERNLNFISSSIDDDIHMEYEPDNIFEYHHKMQTLSFALLLIHKLNESKEHGDNRKIPDSLQKVVEEKIKDMKYTDFYTFISEYVGINIFFDRKNIYDECVIHQIETMEPAELAHFLRQLPSIVYKMSDAVKKAIEIKTIAVYSPFVDNAYNELMSGISFGPVMVNEHQGAYKLKTMESLKRKAQAIAKETGAIKIYTDERGREIEDDEEGVLKQPEYGTYLEMLRSMKQTEFMVYMCFHFRKRNTLYSEEGEVIEEQLRKLSSIDLLVMVKGAAEIRRDEVSKNDRDVVLRVAKERGLFDEYYNPKYTREEQEAADKKFKKMMYNYHGDILSRVKFEDIDEDTFFDEYGGSQEILMACKRKEEAKKKIGLYSRLDRLSRITDKKRLVIEINKYNLVEDNQVSKELDDFFRYATYSLPAVYCAMLRPGKNDNINNAIEMKVEEFQKEFLRYRNRRQETGSLNNYSKGFNNAEEPEK